MPRQLITVCIAAYNEAATIGRLLEQLATSAGRDVIEIIVCANGCVDDTEAIVSQHTNGDKRVRLIRRPRGKPEAWNAMVAAADCDLCLFLDADVELAPDFFSAIREAILANQQAAIIAARDLPRRSRHGPEFIAAAAASRAFGFDYVCGRAYLIRRSILGRGCYGAGNSEVADRPVLPVDVLGEDLWLEVAVGAQLIAFAPDARVYYDPGCVDDLLRSRARMHVARMQVASLLPTGYARWLHETGRSAPVHVRIRRRLRTFDGVLDAVAGIASAVIRWILVSANRSRLRELESAMMAQMVRQGGHEVLGGTGRTSRSRRR